MSSVCGRQVLQLRAGDARQVASAGWRRGRAPAASDPGCSLRADGRRAGGDRPGRRPAGGSCCASAPAAPTARPSGRGPSISASMQVQTRASGSGCPTPCRRQALRLRARLTLFVPSRNHLFQNVAKRASRRSIGPSALTRHAEKRQCHPEIWETIAERAISAMSRLSEDQGCARLRREDAARAAAPTITTRATATGSTTTSPRRWRSYPEYRQAAAELRHQRARHAGRRDRGRGRHDRLRGDDRRRARRLHRREAPGPLPRRPRPVRGTRRSGTRCTSRPNITAARGWW